MNKIESFNKINALVSELRNLKKGYVTNFYPDETKMESWIIRNQFYYESYEEVLFLIKDNGAFYNLFYCATNNVMLEKALLLFNEKHLESIVMTDIVGNEQQCRLVGECFKKCNFSEYVSLVRMSRMTPKNEDNHIDTLSPNVKFAKIEQAEELYSLLSHYFDPLAEQLPTMEEIRQFVLQRQILVYSENNKIVGFVIFEKNSSTLYLRYWFVHPEHRNKKIGSSLLKLFFNEGKTTRRQLFWVIQNNKNAIIRYEHYGFKKENMYDFVLTNKSIRYEQKDY